MANCSGSFMHYHTSFEWLENDFKAFSFAWLSANIQIRAYLYFLPKQKDAQSRMAYISARKTVVHLPIGIKISIPGPEIPAPVFSFHFWTISVENYRSW